MCKYCHEHGEGKKWYLQSKNYAQDLESDLKRRSLFDINILIKDIRQSSSLIELFKIRLCELVVNSTSYVPN
jgi:hypothetical protein